MSKLSMYQLKSVMISNKWRRWAHTMIVGPWWTTCSTGRCRVPAGPVRGWRAAWSCWPACAYRTHDRWTASVTYPRLSALRTTSHCSPIFFSCFDVYCTLYKPSVPDPGSTGSRCFWPCRIRILLSSNKNSKNNPLFLLFCDFFWTFYP